MDKSCSSARAAYIDHCMACRDCYAPSARYCAAGQELLLQADAEFVAGLADLNARRKWMAVYERRHPSLVPRLKELVTQMYKGAARG